MADTFHAHVAQALQALEQAQLLRSPRQISGSQGPQLTMGDQTVLSLCSNNYLGLANHPAIAKAAAQAMETAGYGAAASRHISGTADLHRQAERALAQFTANPAALLYSSGYAANVGTIQALMGPQDLILSDELNHASIIDGCRLSRARVAVYRHGDMDHLESLLTGQRPAARAALIVTDALFSMDGDQANLPALRRLADAHGAGLLVDEAHSLGVFGPAGTGLCAMFHVKPDALIGTLGKAFGAAGAFVAGAPDMVRLVENRARSYVFSTAPPPAMAAAACAALDLVRAGDDLRANLADNSTYLRQGLTAMGYRVVPGDSPIIPLLVGDPGPTMAMSAALLEHGVFVHGIRPPTVPVGSSRLRITVMASHTRPMLDQALSAFEQLLPTYPPSPQAQKYHV